MRANFGSGAINFVSRILVVCMGKRYEYHQFCILTEPNLVSILYLMSQQGNSLADYQLTDPLRHSGGPREVSLLLLLHSFTHRPSHSWGNFCSGVKITIDGFKF